ncbi:MAG: WbqC family protein [Sphingobacteriales bacterium]|nr:WbqC family protein [Sphingobacteriales bacterium]MBI3718698.1 WbqC family protein [Sphingobacteriales bacterium]
MSTLIIENHYLPCAYFFKILFNSEDVKIEQYEFYQKMSFRNRCLLAGPNGLLSLTVPLEKGRNQRTSIREVPISYKDNWRLIHWRSIHDAYRKSPFFEWYMDDIKSLFDKKPEFLFDWNLQWLEWLIKQTGQQIKVGLTDSFVENYPAEVMDWRDKINPKNYLAYAKDIPKYTQVFENRNAFSPNLSALDLLLCEGKPGFSRLMSL